jgi:hypothetical protein
MPAPRMTPEATEGSVRGATRLYTSGKYRAAEEQALSTIRQSKGSKDSKQRVAVAQARYVAAFSAARQGDLKTARTRFAVLREDAATVRGPAQAGKPVAMPARSLEEQGAYQHAVLTAAMGDRVGAEREYCRFMEAYPDSPLVGGAVLRIRRFHEGNLPKSAEKVWERSRTVAIGRIYERKRQEAMCGPECMAELLRRRGEEVSVEALAREMRTDDRGTTLKNLAATAQKHGYKPRGVQLTSDGLRKQKLPAIALVGMGHYVIVETTNWLGVSVWDPNGGGAGRSSRFSWKDWQRTWNGVSLVL